MYLLIHHLLPSLYHEMVFAGYTMGNLTAMDREVRANVRKWLRFPHDTAIAYFHADTHAGGLEIPSLRHKLPCTACAYVIRWRSSRTV